MRAMARVGCAGARIPDPAPRTPEADLCAQVAEQKGRMPVHVGGPDWANDDAEPRYCRDVGEGGVVREDRADRAGDSEQMYRLERRRREDLVSVSSLRSNQLSELAQQRSFGGDR